MTGHQSQTSVLPLQAESIPDLLKRYPQWVLWKNVIRPGDKPTKIPFSATTLRAAKSNDSSTWCSFDTAFSAYQRHEFDGIGFAFSEKSPYLCGIDIDHCVAEDGTLNAIATKVIFNFSNTYCEYSPSGRGVRIFCLGTPRRCGKGTLEKTIELYNHTSPRYLTVTGQRINGTGDYPASCDDALEWLHEEYFIKPDPDKIIPSADDYDNHANDKLSEYDLLNAALAFIPADDYEEWTHVGMALKNGGYPMSLWDSWSQKSSKYRSGACSKKWNTFRNGGLTIATVFSKAKEHGFTYPKSYRLKQQSAAKTLPVTQEKPINAVRAESKHFWYEITKSTDDPILLINDLDFLVFLHNEGFGRYWLTDSYNEQTNTTFVRVVNRLVREVSIEQIRDHVFNYVESLTNPITKSFKKESLLAILVKKTATYFNESRLKWLKALNIKFHRDSEKSAFFYYQNCFVEVNDNGITSKPYESLDGVIWARQVIQREFHRLSPAEVDQGVFTQFQKNICRNRDEEFDDNCDHGERLKSLQCAIGYCLHRYRTSTRIAAVIFNDERISDEPRGRSGKGLTCAAISKIRTMVLIDGKQFDPDYQHNFQNVKRDTNLVLFDDLAKRFDLERLFALLSNGLNINIKGQSIPIEIPFADSPKFILTTNYVVGGDSDSHIGRKWELTASPYYDVSFTPEMEFRMRLFEDFGVDEWQKFDNYMMLCAKKYLQFGMFKYVSENLAMRKLIQATNTDFIDFANEIARNAELNKHEILSQFKQQNPDYDKVLLRTFTKWLKEYAKNHIELTYTERRSHGQQLFCFTEKE